MRSKIVTAGLCALALVAGATAARAEITGLFYQELEQNGRVYVFNTPERLHSFQQSGDIGTAVTLIGKAEGGKTLVGENETAVDLYLFKHNLPGYDRATPKPEKPSKYPETKIQGRFFGDFTSKENKDDATGSKSNDSGIGTDVKRFYFTVTHSIDETWSAQFQSDIGDVGTKRYDVFVKKAFLQGKFSDAVTLRIGSADTPWIPYAEGRWGRRYFENTITDSLGFGTSADWGLHLLGKLAGGKVEYQVSALNGKSYSKPDRSESVDFEGRIGFKPVAGLTLAVGGYSGKLGNETKNTSTKHTANRTNALIDYVASNWSVGGEWFEAKNWKNVTTDATDKADGFSIWGDFTPVKSINVFARYDQAKPSKDLAPDKKFTYYTVGVEKVFNKVLTGTLAYKYAEAEGGTIGTSNGTIGSADPTRKGKYQEIGVWAVYNF